MSQQALDIIREVKENASPDLILGTMAFLKNIFLGIAEFTQKPLFLHQT